MKLLFDQNISFRITKLLSEAFPDCIHVSQCGLLDSEDPEIWQYAKRNNYAIVPFDSDFFEISLIKGHPPKIIWIRTGNLTTNRIASLIENNQTTIIRFLSSNEFQHSSCLELE
jgi:predicted nuclease of predicted toxin-antitoxin system